MRARIVFFAAAMLALLLLSALSAAQPLNATGVNRGLSERGTSGGASSAQPSEAGNMTTLSITATDLTKRWQGFYGNVTGNITLADSSNNALYNWGSADPAGEVYASNGSSIIWNRIFCVNFSANGFEENLNSSTINDYVGLNTDILRARRDSVNATFAQTFGDDGATLTVGSRTFTNADNCSMVTLNSDSGAQTTLYKNVLLTDNNSVVFASILDPGANGFKGHPTDFEMVVGVDGTVQYTTRTYYFFVELS